MARVARWIIETPSWTLAGLSCTALGAVTGGGLYARQCMLKDHQVCRAATEQLEGAWDQSAIQSAGTPKKATDSPEGLGFDAVICDF